MSLLYYHEIFAQAYGQGTYDNSTYGQATSSGTGSGSSASNGLTNTGIAIASIVTIAAVLLLIALVVRIWRRSGEQVAPEVIEADATDDVEEASSPLADK